MGYFASTKLQKEFELKDGNRFTARKITAAERANIQDAGMKVVQVGKAEQEMHFDTGKIKIEQLAVRIVGWEGDGFEGFPVTKANINALPPEVVDEMSELLDEWDKPLTEEEKKA